MRIWTAIGIVSSFLFLLLCAAFQFAPGAVGSVDTAVAVWVASFQTYPMIGFFLAVTALGGAVAAISVGVAFAYIARLSNTQVLRLMSLLLAVMFANRILKGLFSRERPDPLAWFDLLPSFSFPSAHASGALALYGFIALYLYRRTQRLSYAVIPLLVILLVGLSRIVLNAHHLSDVVGGYLLGLTLLACALLFPFDRLFK